MNAVREKDEGENREKYPSSKVLANRIQNTVLFYIDG